MNNRAIKFRVWTRGHEGSKDSHGMMEVTSLSHFSSQYVKAADALMQYTGLLDKNGKEIYEGDIVIIRQYPPTNNKPQVVFYTPETASFVMSKTGYPPSIGIGGYRLEIIGNIYENPDLLKEDSKEAQTKKGAK